ncbi:MAG: hypothetical protein WCF01_11325, partial [Nitrososphaeraceae archaeon]
TVVLISFTEMVHQVSSLLRFSLLTKVSIIMRRWQIYPFSFIYDIRCSFKLNQFAVDMWLTTAIIDPETVVFQLGISCCQT